MPSVARHPWSSRAKPEYVTVAAMIPRYARDQLKNGLSNHFFYGRNAFLDFNQSGAAQRDHSVFHGPALDVDGAAAGENHVAQLVVDGHDFDQSDAPFVAGVVALVAAAALQDLERTDLLFLVADVEQRLRLHFHFFFALRADTARQSLRSDELHGRGDEERLDAHVHETVDRRRRIVRVQSGEHEMSGQRRFDRDLRRLEVADLTDQNDVRVLPEERSQRGGEVQSDRLFHLHLIDAGQIEFDRIFGGHDVDFGRIHFRQRRVKRIRLAAACGPGHKNHSPRFEDRFLEFRQRLLLEAELGHVEAQVVLVEKAENDLLSEECRKNGDAKVELFVLVFELDLELDASVLRKALFGDVELRENLHARGHGVAQLERRVHDLVEDSVDAEADAKFFFVRLDVNVGCAAFDGVGEHEVAELHDRRFFGGVGELADIHLLFFFEDFEVGILGGLKVFHDLLQFE